MLNGEAPYSDTLPNVHEGFTAADLKDTRRAADVVKVIPARLRKAQQEPLGHLVRQAPAESIQQLRLLTGHLRAGEFLTRIRKTFTREEMSGDLALVPARVGEHADTSEYEECLASSPP
jgi:hypothetical protein